ncbi:class I SAM-dependent methyltransferase [Actinotalea solisilvae]|uniref:class I SAM-dependent methyltransferase n=1 Tax=Actinotalea solisilvae TaxID=2072922 RepID=UPI0018F2100B|nr:class I SAM-dependent methyltransferase [Actinotalea solisilvae]
MTTTTTAGTTGTATTPATTAATTPVTTPTTTTGRAHPRSATLRARLGATVYDPFLARGERLGLERRRIALLAGARGRVLEIGTGTGLNLAHYPADVEELVLTEPVAPMADRARARLAASGRAAEVLAAPAEDLPVATASVDTVVSTLVLCTVRDVESALSEVARVLRPGGRLLFVEHVHAAGTALGRWQTRLAGPWAGCAGGCRCDRDLLAAITARFEVRTLHRAEWTGMPGIVRPLVVGTATPSRAATHGAWEHHVTRRT